MATTQTKEQRFLRHLEPLQAALEAYCRRCVHDANEVADVLQSTIAATYRDFHLYAEGTNFRAWIFRYLHLTIQNANRKHHQTRHDELPDELAADEVWSLALDEPLHRALLDDPDVVLDCCDAVVSAAIQELPTLERSVLLLQAVGAFKYREIAEILQIPVGTVMSSLARCRLRLRQHLVDYGVARGLLKTEET